jgi:cytochrome b561
MQRYSLPAILLHWAIALLIVAAFALGTIMVDIPGLTPTKLRYYSWHKWLGVTVMGLACLRLLWRLLKTPPPPAATLAPWQRRASHATHLLLYVLIFAVPISGYFYSLAAGVPVVYLGIFPLPVLIERNQELKEILKEVHYWLNMALLAAVALHVAAALKHHFVDRDEVLKRMLPRMR